MRVVTALIAFPIVPWLLAGSVTDRFTGDAALHSVANIAALTGVAAWAVNLVLASRTAVVERVMGGLEDLYAVHRSVGVLVVVLAATHAVFLTLYDSIDLFSPTAGWEAFTGVIALAALVAFVAATVAGRLEYQRFLLVQRLLGVAFLVGAVHTFAESGTKAHSIALTVYLAVLTAAGVAALGHRLLGLGRTRHTVYEAHALDADTLDIVLRPEGPPLAYEAGQFAYLTVHQPGIPRESHPFTIASPPAAGYVRMVVKRFGDFTGALMALQAGAPARLEGPFGHFLLPETIGHAETWIAGGIGITPFLSWARSLKGNRPVDLFYCTPAAEQAHFHDELLAIADRFPAFRVIPVRKTSLGRLGVDDILAVNPNLAADHVFICGPLVMLDNMTAGLLELGMPRDRIHTECFDFRGRFQS